MPEHDPKPARQPKPAREPIHPADLQTPGDSIDRQVDRRTQQILNRKRSRWN